MEETKMKLEDVVDLCHLQKMQDTFASVSGITSVIIGVDGLPITRPSNLKGYCAMMQNNEKSLQHCIQTNMWLVKENLKTKKPSVIICPHSGLTTGSVPIFLGEQLLGCWILGQVRMNDPEDAVFEKTAKVIEKDPKELKRLLHALPIIKEEMFESIFDYLITLSETLIKLAKAGYETRQKNEKLKYIAYYDQEMNLPNTLKFIEDFENENAEEIFLLCLDVKQLRRLNDVYGREAGDELLKTITKWVKRLIGEASLVYRLEGDEFGLLLAEMPIDEVIKLADQISKRFQLEWKVNVEEAEVFVLCGVNICILEGDVTRRKNDSIVSTIERAMEISRDEERIAIYDEVMDQEFKEQLQLEISLKNAIKSGMQGFSVHYQPIVSVDSGKWSGLEALCRWNSKEFGNVPPGVFIQEIEKMGLIEVLGDWVFEEAVRQCSHWGLQQLDEFILDVNFSPIQISGKDLDKKVLTVLEKYSFPGKNLCIEVTESMEVMIDERIQKNIDHLCNEKITVALDDFGVGYSSFQSLKDIPAGTLKTERAFLQGIEQDEYLRNVFRIMVELAHVANKKLIAEGVETQTQLNYIMESKADYVQGYFFSKPLSANELEDQLYRFSERDERVKISKIHN